LNLTARLDVYRNISKFSADLRLPVDMMRGSGKSLTADCRRAGSSRICAGYSEKTIQTLIDRTRTRLKAD